MKKSIFNSLGSNYSNKFVATSLLSIFNSKKSEIEKLEKYLSKTYHGETLTLYKGRDAIEACCRVLLKPKSKVITQAFSCYAVEEGIKRAGMKPIYADIGLGITSSTNLNITTLRLAFKKHPDAKAVLIQHSLGIVADSPKIRKWCDQNGLLLIEDVAQGIGGLNEEGNILGANADAVIFSFGRDKIIDTISGGAVVFRNMNDEKVERLENVKELVKKLPLSIVYSDLIYPAITLLSRKTHHLFFGKVILVFSKYLKLLDSPVKSKVDHMTSMHPSYAKLAMLQFKNLEKQMVHRKKMAIEYLNCFKDIVEDSKDLKKIKEKSKIKSLLNKTQIEQSSNLRFSIRCKDLKQVKKFIKELKNNRIYVDDRWYRSAVDCGKFDCKSSYKQGSCPNAELLATKVLNLPTHREMDVKKVRKICKIIGKLVE